MNGKLKLAAALAAALLALPLAAETPRSDAAVQSAVTQRLEKKQFRDIKASVDDGMVTLQGTVARLQDKLDAEKRARKTDGVTSVKDDIQVAGVNDDQLRNQLSRKLAYDRSDWWNVFNVIQLGVNQGVVTLDGEVRTPSDKQSALELVAETPGVQAVVDHLKVAPASFNDDDIRVRTLRAIYRDPVLSKYALDPQAPIRILVDNGRVGLYGTVDNSMDKQLAMMRASEVFGAFQVQNHLTTPADQAR